MAKKKTAWQEHLEKVRRENPELSFAEVSKKASETYVRPTNTENTNSQPVDKAFNGRSESRGIYQFNPAGVKELVSDFLNLTPFKAIGSLVNGAYKYKFLSGAIALSLGAVTSLGYNALSKRRNNLRRKYWRPESCLQRRRWNLLRF